jgi:hypothetical protein
MIEANKKAIRLLINWDELSEKMADVHSPGIEWVWIYGMYEEKTKEMSELILERGKKD